MAPFKRILVAIDFSAASDAALDYARVLAGRFDGTLDLLHVVDLPYIAYGPEAPAPDLRAIRQAAHDDAEHGLSARMTPEECEAFGVTFAILDGSPVAQIVRYASDRNMDLIVMGTHGRTGLVHVLLGSVAERTLRAAPCPVLTVRARTLPQAFVEASRELAAPRALA